jgi:alpha-L-fucosidase
MIFVAKHVGGYCAWQTKTTDYSLKTSPWKQGQGDMLAELSRACQARGVRLTVEDSVAPVTTRELSVFNINRRRFAPFHRQRRWRSGG